MWYNEQGFEEARVSVAKPQNLGLIDTLSAGYQALHRCLWVLVVPAAVSAYLWLGAPLALGSAAATLQHTIADAASALGGDRAVREQLALELLTSDARVTLAWLNFVPLLEPAPGAAPAGIGLNGPLQVVGAALAINALALFVSSFYLTVLSAAVRGDAAQPLASARRAGLVARDILLAVLALLGVGLVLALPLLAISAIIIIALPGATLLVLLLWYIALFWAYVYTGFAPEAISLSHAGPLRAIYNSVRIVRRDLSGTVGLLLLSYVIVNGLAILWRQLAATPAGLAVAILGSAYVGGGLSAARIEFYRARAARWVGASPQ